MVSVKVCLWNIQNFGQNAEKYNGHGLKDQANALRNDFIARFIVANAIDVVLVQEVSSTATPALTNLQTKLNALNSGGAQDWSFSWCGSAIADGNVDVVRRPKHVAFRTGARTEGYAVLWRSEQTKRFTMVQALNQIAAGTNVAGKTGAAGKTSPLNISQLGRPTATEDGKFAAIGGFRPPVRFPYQKKSNGPGYDRLTVWPKLSYPPTARTDALGVQWAKSRRPVYVVLKLKDDDDHLCVVSVYHAPSSQSRASWGAFVAGLSRELYATERVENGTPSGKQFRVIDKGVFGGDFNLSVNKDKWPGDYQYFTAPFGQAAHAGANRTETPGHAEPDAKRRTTVQLLADNHKTAIKSKNADDYLKWKIDLAFCTGNVTAKRVDLLAELTTDSKGIYSGPLQSTHAFMAAVQAGIAKAPATQPQRLDASTGPQKQVTSRRKEKIFHSWVPIISGAWGGTFTDWPESLKQFQAGRVTDPRRAAEFIHIFVSDHLPLVAEVPA